MRKNIASIACSIRMQTLHAWMKWKQCKHFINLSLQILPAIAYSFLSSTYFWRLVPDFLFKNWRLQWVKQTQICKCCQNKKGLLRIWSNFTDFIDKDKRFCWKMRRIIFTCKEEIVLLHPAQLDNTDAEVLIIPIS